MATLLADLAEQLTTTAADTPLAALRAADVLERITTRASRAAAGMLDADVSAEGVATALGTPAGPKPQSCS